MQARRPIFIAITSFAAYVVIAETILAHAALGPTLRGLTDLRGGEAAVLDNPAQAELHFQAGETAALSGLAALRATPWWCRLLAPLPPFTWAVHLEKASYSLSAAGALAANLHASAPDFTPPTDADLSSLVTGEANRYLDWYQPNATSAARLISDLGRADEEAHQIPPWALGPGGDQFVQSLDTLAGEASDAKAASDVALQAFGSQDTEKHTLLAWFPDTPDNGSLAVLTAQGGRADSFAIGEASTRLGTAWATVQTYPFWPQRAEALASASSEPAPSAIALVPRQALLDLLQASGPLLRPGVAGQMIDATSFSEQDLGAEEVVPLLLPRLLDSAPTYQALMADSHTLIHTWSPQTHLEMLATQLNQGELPPSSGNWLAISGSSDITIQQVNRFWRDDTVQHIEAKASGTVSFYLPSTIQPLDGSSSSERDGFRNVSVKSVNGTAKLTYSLPGNIVKPNHVTLVVSGTPVTVEAFGKTVHVDSTVVLTP
jgi:hypothetical protein